MGEQTYLYFREPGGVRLEFDSGGYRNYQPDWEPVKWMPSQGSNTMYRNMAMPDSMMEAFPPAAAGAVPEGDLAGMANPWAAQEDR
jgi:catechol 2,3-dioxygenase